MGLFHTRYKRNVSKGRIGGICEGSVYITQSTNEDHIGSRPKVHNNILGSLYSKTRNPNGDFNGISPINRWANKETKPDVKTVLTTLCQLRTEQLGIVITNYIVCIQCNTTRG